MRNTLALFIAALTIGVANAQTTPVVPANVEITQSGDGGVTITVHRSVKDDKGKAKRVSTSTPVKAQKYKERDGRHEETYVVLTCNEWDGTAGTDSYKCKTWDEKRYSTPEEIEKARAEAVVEAKAYTANRVDWAVKHRPQMRNGKLVMTPRFVEPECDTLKAGYDPLGNPQAACSHWTLVERDVLGEQEKFAKAQTDQGTEVAKVRSSAVFQPTRQPYELMLGAGATGIMDLGGALVAVGDVVWGSDRWPLGLVLHGEFGDMSDGQGLFGCAAVGMAKPMPGTSTTVGVLGGWCGSENSDLDGANFWHAAVQVRHRVLRDWLALGVDLKGGALWREKVVNQTVREVRDPAFGALGFVAVNFR